MGQLIIHYHPPPPPMAQDKQNKKIDTKGSTSLKELEKKKKTVFKPILDNPYTQSNLWPFIEPSLGTSILQLLEVLLSPIGKYNQLDKQARASINQPDIIAYVYHGFNSTVEVLESQARHYRDIHKNRKLSQQQRSIKYLFVCKYDITPGLLTSMFPVLSYTASKSRDDRVKLVQLGRGSMQRLSAALGVENSGIVGVVENRLREAQPLFELVDENVGDVQVPWLDGLLEGDASGGMFASPALRYISMSAPSGPKRKKQKVERKEEKEEGKELGSK